jgi:anion-transporting  ArsA/GET3 family ATPase
VSHATRNIDRKFLFVTGKGGVGKSTVSVALARALASRGRRVLLAVTEQAQVGPMLGGVEITTDVQVVDEGLSVIWVEPERSLRDYGEITLRSRIAYQALFGNRYAQAFLAAIPGLHQWASLGKAWFHADGDRALGGASFDHVVFDAPATGHGLEMLRVPKVITEASPPGILRRDAAAAWDMLQDPTRAGVVVVTLPEELPVQEALELTADVAQLGVPLAAIVMNAVPAQLFSSAEVATLGEPRIALSEAAKRWVEVAVEHGDAQVQAAALHERVSRLLDVPILRLPWVAEPEAKRDMAALVAAVTGETTA